MGLKEIPEPADKKKEIADKSDKLKKADKEYQKIRKQFLLTHLKCEVKGCNHVATEVHHQKGRHGALLLDTNFFLAVCSPHHKKIEEHPAWAKQEGYSISRLQKSIKK